MSERTKTCASCGRVITWRKKWQDCWEQVRHCSERCRRDRRNDSGLEAVILGLLDDRARGATICPSEAARRHFGEDAWRPQMERTRRAARRLVAAREIEMVQRGHVVDASTAKGPIRLRKCHSNG